MIKISNVVKNQNRHWSIMKTNKSNNYRNSISINFLIKIFLWAPICIFWDRPDTKTVKICVVTSTSGWTWLRKPKPWTYIYWPYTHLSHHLTWPIDRSRSQLFTTFFPASMRFLNRPKRSILFSIFLHFFWTTLNLQVLYTVICITSF